MYASVNKKLLRDFILMSGSMLGAVLSLFFYCLQNAYVQAALHLLLWSFLFLIAASVWHVFDRLLLYFPLLVFILTFSVLLLGRVFVVWIFDYDGILHELEADSFSNLYLAVLVLYVSFLFVCLAYRFGGFLFRKQEKMINRGELRALPSLMNPLVPFIRKLSLIGYLIAAVPFFISFFHRIQFILSVGYLGSYVNTMESNPLLSRLSNFFYPLFVIFLATVPSKKQMRLPLVLFGFYMLISLLTGRRNILVKECLVLIAYFILRAAVSGNGKKFITKTTVILAGCLSTVVMWLLELFGRFRAGMSIQGISVLEGVRGFFVSQGASFRVMIQTINQFGEFSPESAKSFLFYPFELFFANSPITQALFGATPIVEVQTVAFVQNTHNLGHFLTYMVNPQRYLSGGGFGTSAFAESYLAFGLPGVIVISILIGISFRFFSSLLARSWIVTAFGIMLFKNLIYIPRDFAFGWVFEIFSVTNILSIIVLFIGAVILYEFDGRIRKKPVKAIAPERQGSI